MRGAAVARDAMTIVRGVVVALGGVLLPLVGPAGCAAQAPAMSASHPADPAAKGGRLAGPPAILRAARASAVTEAEDVPPPNGHDHGAHPTEDRK
jgi:hypothetical protein